MAKRLAEITSKLSLEGFKSKVDTEKVGAVVDSQPHQAAPEAAAVSQQSVGSAEVNQLAKARVAPPPLIPGVNKHKSSFTAPGSLLEVMSGKNEVSKELELTKALLKEYEGSAATRRLDPNIVCRSTWANRNPKEFVSEEFRELKDEIMSAGGNVQPILVRKVVPLVDGQPPYEIVFGHRRHQACLELGIPVLAMIQEFMTDRELFEAMERENRSRKSLSAWERGIMYLDALNRGLYDSARKLEEALNINHSDCTRALQIARLPQAVIDAFPSPLDIQFRWAGDLTEAVVSNPDGVVMCANRIQSERVAKDIPAKQVFYELTKKQPSDPSPARKANVIAINGVNLATLRHGPKGRDILEFEKGAISPHKREELINLVQQFLSK